MPTWQQPQWPRLYPRPNRSTSAHCVVHDRSSDYFCAIPPPDNRTLQSLSGWSASKQEVQVEASQHTAVAKRGNSLSGPAGDQVFVILTLGINDAGGD